MDKQEIYHRCHYLFFCLQFTKNKITFSPGERIVINQEIASLLHKWSYSQAEVKKVTLAIEVKLKTTKQLINQYEWIAENQFPYDEILK